MRTSLSARYLAFCLAAGLFASGCSLLQTIPVNEQSYLQYQVNRGYGGTSQVTLHFKDAGRNMIEVVAERSAPAVIPGSEESWDGTEFPDAAKVLDSIESKVRKISPTEDRKILISRFCTQKGGLRYELEGFGPLWLPSGMLQPGRMLALGYSGRTFSVGRQKLWNGRQVVTLQNGNPGEARGILYYSSNTGFLVGCEEEGQTGGASNGPTLKLSETNVEGLLSVNSP